MSDKKYQGVYEMTPTSFRARLSVAGRNVEAGSWPSAKEAAIACDRLVLGLRLPRELNFSREARRKGPATSTELVLEAKKRRQRIRAAALGLDERSYLGVCKLGAGVYRAAIELEGRFTTLGRFPTAEEAAKEYDRACWALRRDPARLNFRPPKGRPWTPKERVTQSSFVGVHPRGERWDAYVNAGEKRHNAGRWATEHLAAIARDRAVLALGLEQRLNLPKESMRAGPLDPAALRRLAIEQRPESDSGYIGVRHHQLTQRFYVVHPEGAVHGYESAKDAAVARDRAWRQYGGDPTWLNFPKRRPKPATIEQLRAETRAVFKARTSSQYRGVSWSKQAEKWRAGIVHKRRTTYLGSFDDEELAALAYDKAARRLHGDRAKLNFPED